MRKWTLGGLGMLVSLVLAAPAVWAQTPDAAAAEVAKELASALQRGVGSLESHAIVLTPFAAPDNDPVAVRWAAKLGQLLVRDHGAQLIDREALKAVLAEASLLQSAGGEIAEATLKEIALGFGAKGMVTGSLRHTGDSYVVEARAIRLQDGVLLTASTAQFVVDGAEEPLESRSLTVQLRRMADRLSQGLEQLDGELRYQRVAILPFQEVGPSTQDKQLGTLVSSVITTVLVKDHNLLVVERSQLAKVIDELALGQTGLVDESKTLEVGRLAGAQGLVIGSVSEAGDRYLVSARVVSVGTGQVVLAEETQLPAADMVALSSEAVVLRTRAGAVYRSLLLPGWGQIYNRQPIKSATFVGTEVAAFAVAAVFHLRGTGFHDDYRSKKAGTPQLVLDDLVAKEESSYSMRNWMIIAGLAVHAFNVLDAFISGRTFDTADFTVNGSSATIRF